MKALCFLPTSSARIVNDLAVIARTSGAEFVHCHTEDEVVAHMEGDPLQARCFLLSDQDQADFVVRFANRYPDTLIMLGLKSQVPDLASDIRKCLPIHSFVAYSENAFDPCDFLVTLKKLRTRDIFGVDKYLKGSTKLTSFDIYNRADKCRVIERVGDAVRYLGGNSEESRFHQYGQRVSDMLDELVLNAIFGANPRFSEAARDTDFQLSQTESIRVEWGFDGDIFGLSVRDGFGLLTKDVVLKYLDNALERGEVQSRRSGGMGLRQVFDRLHKFVVNVNPQFITEVLCLMRFDRRIRDFDARLRSFHYFKL